MGDSDGGGVRRSRPENDDSRLWSTRTAILTPGDRVEYKFTVKQGDSIFASATSEIFDVALSIEDEKGKELAKNDDRAEGDQSPFLAYHFPAAGTYRVKVLSYRSAAGGRFTLQTRTFRALDAKLEPQVHVLPPPERDAEIRTVFRLAGKKGVTYDLRRVFGVQPTGSTLSFRQIVGPSGVDESDVQVVATPDGTPVFEASTDGDFYVEYNANGSTQAKTDYRPVAVLPTKPVEERSLDFSPGELKIVELPVKPGLIVRSTLSGRGLSQRVTAPEDPNRSDRRSNDPAFANNRSWTLFRLDRDSEDDVVRVFHGTGTARFVIRSSQDKPQKVTLKNGETLMPWTADQAIEGNLRIGESRLFLLAPAKTELTTLSVKATQFLVKLDIFRLDGELANTLMDRQTNAPSAELYYPTAEPFIVRVTCDGYGGSGGFTMRRDTAVATAIAVGSSQSVTLKGGDFRLLSVDLEAGKRYQLLTDGADGDFRVDILDEEGEFLGSQGVRFDDISARYFVPKRTGRHRLWIRGQAGTRKLEIKPMSLPKIGG